MCAPNERAHWQVLNHDELFATLQDHCHAAAAAAADSQQQQLPRLLEAVVFDKVVVVLMFFSSGIYFNTSLKSNSFSKDVTG
jgi:hypothetical protein